MSQQPSKIIVIVGAGFTGSTIAIQQARHYMALAQQDADLPPLTIHLVDETGTFGTGQPYRTQDDIFLLNQPASAMSPFPDDAAHFTRWLGGDGNVFATRQQYGAYLQEILRQTFNEAATAHLPVKLQTISARVTDISTQGEKVTLTNDSGVQFIADSVVLATGHQKGKLLAHLEGDNRYFSGAYDVEDVREALKDATRDDSVAIVGTGQSMMDALAVLDKIHYPGTIYALSRHGAEPWAYYPEHYNETKPPYAPVFLDPARVKREQAWSANQLRLWLCYEFRRGAEEGYDIGHVLAAIDFAALAKAGPEGTAPEGLKDMRKLWEKIYGNPTAPERYELFRQYKDSGYLRLLRCEVSEDNVEKRGHGFLLHVGGEEGELRVSALFNAAAFDRHALAAPLLKKAAAHGLLKLHGDAIESGQQKHARVFVAGPPVSPDKWGVETFRDNNAAVARQSIESLLPALTTIQQRRRA